MHILIRQLLSYLPTRLPVGMTEFNKWSQDIIDLAGPMADEDSMRWAIASQVMHQGATSDCIPKRFFVSALRKAAANQVANQVFQDLKIKQQQRAEAEAKAAAEQAASETPAPEAGTTGVEQV